MILFFKWIKTFYYNIEKMGYMYNDFFQLFIFP